MQIRTLDELLGSDRIFIKYGTNAITIAEEGKVPKLNIPRIEEIAWMANTIHSAGKQLIIVSSGAVASGREEYSNIKGANFDENPDTLQRQVLATIGQHRLIQAYRTAFAIYGCLIGQVLVTPNDFKTRDSIENIKNVTEVLLAIGAFPIANTNDTTTSEELFINEKEKEYYFTDNDPMSSLYAVALKLDKGVTSLINVSENGNLGKGKKESKENSLNYGEINGVLTNLYNFITHQKLFNGVKEYFKTELTATS